MILAVERSAEIYLKFIDLTCKTGLELANSVYILFENSLANIFLLQSTNNSNNIFISNELEASDLFF
jgi:hypothetical protein